MESQQTDENVNHCSNNYFPPELLSEILTRLPVKSLLRFRCVCRNWNDLICSSSFIAKHLAYSSTKPCIFAANVARSQPQGTDSLICDSGNSVTFTPGFDEIAFSRALEPQSLKLVGSVNGIVCLSHPDGSTYSSSVILVNPLINKYIRLPHLGGYDSDQYIGFGFKPSEGDLRVLSFPCFGRYPWDTSLDRFCIYSVRQRTWRPVSTGPEFELYTLFNTWQCYMNGAVYWIASIVDFDNDVGDSPALLSFDFEKEVFTFMDLPIYLAEDELEYLFPTTYNGKIAVVHYGIVDGCLRYHSIWTFGEYGNVSSWNLVLRDDDSVLRNDRLEVLDMIEALRGDGRFLLRGSSDSLYLYDSHSKTYDHVPDAEATMRSSLYTPFVESACLTGPFVESLVFMDDEGGPSSF